MHKSNHTVSVIGLGKLGLPLAVSIASRGFKVIGVDINLSIQNSINRKKAPFYEPDLQQFLEDHGNKLSVTSHIRRAVSNSFLIFTVVATPSQKNGDFSLECVLKVIREIGEVLRNKKVFHLVVLTSTVSPLSCERKIIPLLEKSSHKKCGRDFGFCYSPEFIALGSVIKNLLNPEFILIGESDKKSGDLLQDFYQNFCLNSPPISRMSLINAEIAKIALNSYVTMKISFANFLAQLCEAVPGGNVDLVTQAIGQDSRIGKKYLTGAIGFGGPCFPRDNNALVSFAKSLGVAAQIPRAVDQVNQEQKNRIMKLVTKHTPKKGTVGIVGLAYKPDTPVIEDSQALFLAADLAKTFEVFVFDPLAEQNAKKILNNHVTYLPSMDKAFASCQTVIITKSDPNLKEINIEKILSKRKAPLILIDCWRTIKPPILSTSKLKYIALGLNNINRT